jgi:hypothetical protein
MRRRRILLVLTAIIVSIGNGVAYAYFTASASAHGTGQASTGTMATVTLAATAGTPSSTLLPNGLSANVSLEVTNPNSYPVTLYSVTGSGTITGSGSCSPGGTVIFANQTGLSVPIAASTTTQVQLTNAASMTTGAPSGCQGATFSIPVTIVVHK